MYVLLKEEPLYDRFEANNTEPCMRTPAVLDDCVTSLFLVDVSKIFKELFTDIFNLNPTQSVIPTCFNQTPRTPR
jgi:hypothetical protein